MSTAPHTIDAVARLNQRTLFDDIAYDAVRHEMRTWLRYSRAEAARRGDGLSAECLNLPGPVLRWFFTHHRWWSRPAPGTVARWLYLRSMRGIGQLAWLTGLTRTGSGGGCDLARRMVICLHRGSTTVRPVPAR